jgi:hypothetical protein
MQKMLGASLALMLTMLASPTRAQYVPSDESFSPEQLDNLMAPIALYPDPLLAQVLVAATFPDQVDEAARFVRSDSNPDDIDDQPWDISVKAVAHYPETLEMMADKLDWTTSLGQAYVSQSTDVMDAVQRLRAEARSAGNLVTTPEMEVVDSGGEIELWPAQPEYIYVPVYNPAFVFFYRAPLYFRTRFLIGAWLNDDFDWRARRVFYHGWEGGHGGWIDRSRPRVRLTDVYVNRNYRNVVINRTVIDRPVNYGALNRYNDVHRGATFDNVRTRGRFAPSTPLPATRPAPFPTNKIIDRNMNTRDPRIDRYRGHPTEPSPQIQAPVTPAYTPDRGGRSIGRPPQVPVPAPVTPVYTPDRGAIGRAPQVPVPVTPAYTPDRGGRAIGRAPQVPVAVTPAFTPDRGGFDPRQASQRGMVSRTRAASPPPSPPPAPQPARPKEKGRP